MKNNHDWLWTAQQERNHLLLRQAKYLRNTIESHVLPLNFDIADCHKLTPENIAAFQAVEKQAARIAIESLASLAKINELDHLGGGLDLISAFLMTLIVTDYHKTHYTIEHAHTSIGYFSTLAALGFLQPEDVIENFRRSLDIPGHVSWLPGGTPMNGGRLGVMIPVGVGHALGTRAVHGDGSWVVCHCGDAGWISGQALNGFNGANLHQAPITFIMHRNGVQLSGATHQIMNKDPRPIIASLGIEILETPTLHDPKKLYQAYRQAYSLARQGKPSMIYPVGYRSSKRKTIDLNILGHLYGITSETEAFARHHGVTMDTKVWIPGSLMSYRDVVSMLQCIFLVNDLPGGEGHHDGHMKGRKIEEVCSNPMLQLSGREKAALKRLARQPKRQVITTARPAPGSPNLCLSNEVLSKIDLPGVGKEVSARAGVESAYAAIAAAFPESLYIVSCDLDPSTKLGKARKFIKPDHQYEMSIEEQAATLIANGLALTCNAPQLVVISTFAAFFEGIAREGFEMWRYQRNLNGINEGLNVTFHLSHVGAITGRDHFSGWGLDWIGLSLGYLPYLHRFYTPADARAAFIAIRDLAAHYGGHIIGIPRDVLPILTIQDRQEPLWQTGSPWEAITTFRTYPGSQKAIIAVGATAILAEQASQALTHSGIPTDAYVINGFPLPQNCIPQLCARYPKGLVTIEDGLIATPALGLRGFAGLVAAAAYGSGISLQHLGIVDPRIAPSTGHYETWEYFGITKEALIEAVNRL